MIWIAAQPCRATGLIDVDKYGTRVGTIERADGFTSVEGHETFIVADFGGKQF